MSGLDIFLGDPIFDDQHKVVRREFGVKNVIAIAITLYVGNVLMGKMKPKSGKMKGGIQFPSWLGPGAAIILFVLLMFGIIFGLNSVAQFLNMGDYGRHRSN